MLPIPGTSSVAHGEDNTAAAELSLGGTPKAVVIDEAVRLAKRFGGKDSGAFVNGILDRLSKG